MCIIFILYQSNLMIPAFDTFFSYHSNLKGNFARMSKANFLCKRHFP